MENTIINLIVLGVLVFCAFYCYEFFALKAQKRAYKVKNSRHALDVYESATKGLNENQLALLKELNK